MLGSQGLSTPLIPLQIVPEEVLSHLPNSDLAGKVAENAQKVAHKSAKEKGQNTCRARPNLKGNWYRVYSFFKVILNNLNNI